SRGTSPERVVFGAPEDGSNTSCAALRGLLASNETRRKGGADAEGLEGQRDGGRGLRPGGRSVRGGRGVLHQLHDVPRGRRRDAAAERAAGRSLPVPPL